MSEVNEYLRELTQLTEEMGGYKMEMAPLAPRLSVIDAALKGLGPNIAHLSNATVLITGARGFFGKYLVDVLVEANFRKLTQQPINIIALDSLVTGGARVAPEWLNVPNLQTHFHDVMHGPPDVLNPTPTHVWHLAGIASPYWYKKLPEETVTVAVDGTRNMLKLAKDVGAKFMFTSSSEVYQTANVVPTPESYVGAIPSFSERSCYDVSKLQAENLCYIAATRQNTHVSIVRIFNSFGPGMTEQDKRILPRIASAIKAERAMTVYRQRNHSHFPSRTYTPVANTILGFMLVALKGESLNSSSHQSCDGVFNVGLPSPEISVPGLINVITEVTGKQLKYNVVPAPENYETEPMRRCPDIRKIERLGFKPCMDLDTGVAGFFKWALDNYSGIE